MAQPAKCERDADGVERDAGDHEGDAVVGEEGRGDLRGVRHLFTQGRYRDKIDAFVTVDSPQMDTIVVGGVGASIADDPGRYLGFLALYDLIFAILSWASFEYVVTE